MSDDDKIISVSENGAELIPEAQMRELQDLKDKILQYDKLLNKHDRVAGKSMMAAMNNEIVVDAMHLITIVKYPLDLEFLRTWIERLSSINTVLAESPDYIRKRRISYIQINMKKLGIESSVRAYMNDTFLTRSLNELKPNQLENVYRYVLGKKKS